MNVGHCGVAFIDQVQYMLTRSRRKTERRCPNCDAPVTVSMPAAIRYIFLYKPLRCDNCNTNFETSSFGKLVLLTMASLATVVALNMRTLREIQSTESNLHIYLMAGTLFVTLAFAFILSKGRAFVVQKSQHAGKFVLHFATVLAMPGSLLLFVYMAERYPK